MTPIRFPDAAFHAPTAIRAQHVLRRTGAVWTAPGISADYADGQWRVQIDGVPYYLRHDPEERRHVGGGWPSAIPTAFILRRPETDRLVLEIYDVAYQGHGPDHIAGVDG